MINLIRLFTRFAADHHDLSVLCNVGRFLANGSTTSTDQCLLDGARKSYFSSYLKLEKYDLESTLMGHSRNGIEFQTSSNL